MITFARPTRRISLAILFLLVASVSSANLVITLLLGSLSITTAQVGVPFSATIQATGGIVPYTYSIAAGSLPPGLHFTNPIAIDGPMTISGTPTTAGTYSFSAMVSDALVPPPPTFDSGTEGQSAPAPRVQGGRNAAAISNPYSITVSAAAGPAGVPTSPWTLAMVLVGLAGMGFLRLRQTRRV